jgi:hypothetical protein
MAKGTVDGETQPKKKMSKKRKFLIALGVISGLLVGLVAGTWVLVLAPTANNIAAQQLKELGIEDAIVEVHPDGAKITMPSLPASFGGDTGLSGTNVVFEFGGLGVDDIQLVLDGASSGKFVLPEGIHFTMTADTFSEFTNFSLKGTDKSGEFTGAISNARAEELKSQISGGKFVGTDEGTLDSLITGIVLTPGANGTVLTAKLDMALVLALFAQ